MISTTTITRAARIVLQGYLTAAFFKVIVIDRTVLVVSRSEKVSIRLVTSTVCSSTAVLLLATTKAAQQFLSDDVHCVPVLKDVDDTAEPKARFAGGKVADTISTTKALGAPAQPYSSPAVIESTEPAFDGPTEGLSTLDSDMTLIGRDEDLAKDVFSGDGVSDLDSEWLADESTFYEHDCQVTVQCLTDDELEHASPVEYDSHTIDNLIQTMSTLSLDDVPSHFSILSLDNVTSPISTISLDDVASPISTVSIDNVPSRLSPLDDVPSPFVSTLSFDNVSFVDSDVLADESTFYEHNCQATVQCLTDDEPDYTLSAEDDSHTIDNLIRRMSILCLDNVPPPISTQSFDNVFSSVSSLSLDNVSSHSLTLPPRRTLYDHAIGTLPDPSQPSKLGSTHSLDDCTIAHPPGTLPPHSPQSSNCQLQCTQVYDYPIDDLIRMLDFSLNDVPSQISTLRPHCAPHGHPVDALPTDNTKALALDDNLAIDILPTDADASTLDDNHAIAIDTLLQKSAALTLDNNYDIETLPNNADAFAFDDNQAIDALLQSETPTLSDDASQLSKLQVHDDANNALLHVMNAFPLDDSRSRSSEPQLQSTLHGNTFDTLLHKMDALSLDDNPSWSEPQRILHDNILDDSPCYSPRHLHCNTSHTTTPPTLPSEISNVLLIIATLSPRNFNYDAPYTTMLSTPYCEMWNLLFSAPRSR
ncbi:hypothetical protein EDD22DRAFT_907887 [Suillus occidentalis]|nr:hypothetical protein EDD22DRAFT_907887 [Suillus occidentalis]